MTQTSTWTSELGGDRWSLADLDGVLIATIIHLHEEWVVMDGDGMVVGHNHKHLNTAKAEADGLLLSSEETEKTS